MSQPIFVYMTFENEEQARAIGKALLERRCIACINIFPAMTSMYWWKGEMQHASEVAAVAKSTTEAFKELEQTVKELHSYDVPCIVAWPLTTGHSPFLQWIEDETQYSQKV